MKPLSPHDPLDDLIAAALHGDLSPEERAQFDSRINNDPAAQAAYQEAQAMHDLLEKTHREAQTDSSFEQRMVSGVRRKMQTEKHRETAWESLVALWRMVLPTKRSMSWPEWATVVGIVALLSVVLLSAGTSSIRAAKRGVFATITSQLAEAQVSGKPSIVMGQTMQTETEGRNSYRAFAGHPIDVKLPDASKKEVNLSGYLDHKYTKQFAGYQLGMGGGTNVATAAGTLRTDFNAATIPDATVKGLSGLPSNKNGYIEPTAQTVPQGGTIRGSGFIPPPSTTGPTPSQNRSTSWDMAYSTPTVTTQNGLKTSSDKVHEFQVASSETKPRLEKVNQLWNENINGKSTPDATAPAEQNKNAAQVAADNRKLIRNAELDLEVKSFQDTIDKITLMTNASGGYVDTSHSEKGGNGKLRGTVVVKVLPQNLDAFLLRLRDLGVVKNQSVSTDDVTKAYFDTQARLENSRRMETQLQELLKRENGKVSDLLQVERELGRVRGDIEQMQGQLKLYDFQVQYATVSMDIAEKDLKEAAAYLLKETDDFALFATDVEATFQKSKQTAETFKGQVLVATLNHNSGSDVSATIVVSVPPDQIESFLNEVRGLGRVANFTRDTKRVAKDGGDSDQPADLTATEKDKIMVNLSIRSDDESRKQVAMTIVAKAVDAALDQAKAAAQSNAGVEILGSSLNKTPEGASTAQLTVRVPGKDYAALMDSFRALGRAASLSVKRNDNAGPGANGDDAPVIVSLSLTDNDIPIQATEMSVVASDVDTQAQAIKKDAASAGVEVKASSFQRQPDGTEVAEMVFRLPMAKYPAFLDTVKKLGKVESLSVRRDDRPDQTRSDDTAPVDISLQLHNQRGIVADNNGLWATLRQTFGDGASALFGSIRVIGVCVAFLAPWLVALVLVAWIGRRIYVWKKK